MTDKTKLTTHCNPAAALAVAETDADRDMLLAGPCGGAGVAATFAEKGAKTSFFIRACARWDWLERK